MSLQCSRSCFSPSLTIEEVHLLTREEQTAGISRKALDLMQHAKPTNGNGRPRSLSEIMSGYICTRVIDTPMRQIDVLESVHGWVILRDTQYKSEINANVTAIVLDYHQALALAGILSGLSPREEISGPTKKGQA